MTIKILLSIFISISFSCYSQSHKVGQANYNCKLNKKGWFFNSEKFSCPACEKKEKQEEKAKKDEDDRRTAAHTAKVLADRKVEADLLAEKHRKAEEEAKIKREKEAADKIATENARKKYKEIAARGLVKSNVKGKDVDVDLSEVVAFEDNNRKVYGFKLNGEEVMTFPFDENAMNITRIPGSNLFAVNVWGKKNNSVYDTYKYSYLIDITGKRIIVDGNDQSVFRIWIDNDRKVIYFFKNHSIEVTGKVVDSRNEGVGNFHTTRESALADVDSYRRAGWGMKDDEWVCFDTRYTLDLTGKILEKTDGYTVRGGEDE